MPIVPKYKKVKTSPVTDADLLPTVGQTMGAAFDAAKFHNPFDAMVRMADLGGSDFSSQAARLGTNIIAPLSGDSYGNLAESTEGQTGIGKMNLDDRELREFKERQQGNNQWLSYSDALIMEEQAGLEKGTIKLNKAGTNRAVLGEVIRRVSKERKLNEIVARGSTTFARQSATMAAGFAASAIDPLNLATAALPFVGASVRYRSLKAAGDSLGRRGIQRMWHGAVDGFAGTALLEPLPYMASQQDMTDYSIEDVKMSLLFGTILGTGMHTGIGFVSDFSRLSRGMDLNPLPRSLIGTLLDEKRHDVLDANARVAIAGAVQNRIIGVDEAMYESFNIKLNVGDIIDFPQARMIINDNGSVSIYGRSQGMSLTDIIEDTTLPEAVRDMARMSPDMNMFLKQMDRRVDQRESIIGTNSLLLAELHGEKPAVARTVADLQLIDRSNKVELNKILTKEESKPLSTFIEDHGGINKAEADRAYKYKKGGKISTSNRKKLFREKGMSEADAIKLARKAGYDIPEGKGDFSESMFLSELRKDISGEKRVFTKDAEGKILAEEQRRLDAIQKEGRDADVTNKKDKAALDKRNAEIREVNRETLEQNKALQEKYTDEYVALIKEMDDAYGKITELDKNYKDFNLKGFSDRMNAPERDFYFDQKMLDDQKALQEIPDSHYNEEGVGDSGRAFSQEAEATFERLGMDVERLKSEAKDIDRQKVENDKDTFNSVNCLRRGE